METLGGDLIAALNGEDLDALLFGFGELGVQLDREGAARPVKEYVAMVSSLVLMISQSRVAGKSDPPCIIWDAGSARELESGDLFRMLALLRWQADAARLGGDIAMSDFLDHVLSPLVRDGHVRQAGGPNA